MSVQANSRMTGQRESRSFIQEMKFLVTPACAAEIRGFARRRMAADPHAAGANGDEYRVTSLYLDTDDFAVYARRGSFGRSKYRVRRYGAGDRVHLERKLKRWNRVGKLRSIVSEWEAAWLDQAETPRQWAGHWFHQRVQVRGLRPVCQISYSRMARMGMSEGSPIRLTVDEDLRSVPAYDYTYADSGEGTVLLPGQRIVELKYSLEIPGMFKELMQTFDLQPQASSKYRMAVEALGLRQGALCRSF